MSTTDPRYRIVALNVSNFLGISAVDITPDGTLQIISGKNGAGKSSLLDAIVHTLANGRKVKGPKLPVRTGTKKGKVVVVLADAADHPVFKVTRTWTEKGDTLQVTSADGKAEFKTPRALLDALVGELSFDPQAFAKMDEAARARTLRKLVPALDLSDLDKKEAELVAQRLDVGRMRDLLKGQLAGVVVPPAPEGAEPVAVDVSKIVAEKKETVRVRARAVAQLEEIRRARELLNARERAVADLQEQLNHALVQRTLASEALNKAVAEHTFDMDAVDIKLANLDEQINGAAAANVHVSAWRDSKRRHDEGEAERVRRAALVDEQVTSYSLLTTAIEEVREQKRARLAGAELPLPGMELAGDVVTVNKVPFEQLSSAQQLRVGLEMGARLNPSLRVVTMRDGSLLDDEGLAFVKTWAEERDMQVFVERVAGDKPVGVVIEDGHVAGAPPPVEEQTALPVNGTTPTGGAA